MHHKHFCQVEQHAGNIYMNRKLFSLNQASNTRKQIYSRESLDYLCVFVCSSWVVNENDSRICIWSIWTTRISNEWLCFHRHSHWCRLLFLIRIGFSLIETFLCVPHFSVYVSIAQLLGLTYISSTNDSDARTYGKFSINAEGVFVYIHLVG